MSRAFGNRPRGSRLERIHASPNYKDGSFQNLSPTEMMSKDASFAKVMMQFINKPEDTSPPARIKPVKTDLTSVNGDTPAIVWFGHSSYMIRSRGMTILVDPVFSGNASPVSLFAKAFAGADAYSAADFDNIDVLVVTHDHYDHLDYKTLMQLMPKVKHICTSLGVGSHLEHWGIPPQKITELDWWEYAEIMPGIELTATPARHFSGRGIKRGQTLWSGFVLTFHGHRIYIGGDSGYDSHFKEIGEKYGPFEIALLECGQYGQYWPNIHMTPEQTVTAAGELNASVLLPVHWGKFSLALHPWDEPIKRLVAEAAKQGMQITTPQIGEPVLLDQSYPTTHWWEQVVK